MAKNNIVILSGTRNTREVFWNGKLLNPAASKKIANHSPDGFNWSYSGSGPAQLALAVCMRVWNFRKKEDAVNRLPFDYQSFKNAVIAVLPQGDFSIELDLTAIQATYQNQDYKD